MKKIIGLTIAAVLIIALVVGGTWAYFTDTETLTSNTFTAGTIDLSLYSDGVVKASAELDDMKPCQTGYLVIALTNAGNNEMHVWKHIVDITDADRAENGVNEPECLAYGGTWGCEGTVCSCTGGTAQNDIDRYIHFDMWTATVDPGTTPTPPAAADPSWIIEESDNWLLTTNTTDFTAMPVDPAGGDLTYNGVSCYWIYLGTIQPGATMFIVQSFHLDASVGNWAQSDILTFTEEFFAVQTAGTPPAGGWASLLPSGSELPGYELPTS